MMTLGLFLLIMPLMVSTVIRVFGWVVILGNEGLVNQGLRRVGAGDGVRLLYTEGAVILGLAQQSLPFMVLPIMAARPWLSSAKPARIIPPIVIKM
jgi:putative spermidine/putrescine transport system permease protein